MHPLFLAWACQSQFYTIEAGLHILLDSKLFLLLIHIHHTQNRVFLNFLIYKDFANYDNVLSQDGSYCFRGIMLQPQRRSSKHRNVDSLENRVLE